MTRQLIAATLVFAAACSPPPTREDEVSPDDNATLEQALLACPGANTLQGIDVSGYQPNTNWAQVAGSGRKFAIVKATEATGYVNPYFARDWAQIKQNGMIRGAYHFFRPSYDGVAQADHFVDTMGALGPGDLPAMLDLEVTDGVADATLIARMNAFLNRVEQRTGKKPMIYVGFYFWRDTIGNPQGYKSYPLVIAAYVNPCPQVPDQWGTFTMWQYTSTGTIPGITSANVDHDIFNGTLAQLQALAGVVPVVPPTARDFASIGGGKGYILMGNGTLKPTGGAPALATGLAITDDQARSVALRNDGKSGWVLDDKGGLHPFGGAPAMTGPAFTTDIARQVILRSDDKSGWVLDGAGAMHAFGGAGALTGLPAWPGQDLARDVVLRGDDTSGYLLDAWGAVHPFGGAPAVSAPGGYTTGQDVARALVLGFDGQSGYVLQKTGAIYGFGGAPPIIVKPTFAGAGARGFSLDADGVSGTAIDADSNVAAFSADEVRDIALNAQGKGYVLLGTGALKPIGGAPAATGPSFPLKDVARRVVVRPDGASGWVLDATGGVTAFGGAPAVTGAPSWPGQDLGRALSLKGDGTPQFELDAWGGMHPLSGATALTAYPYWQGKDMARDLVMRADGISGYTLDKEGGMGPVGSAPALKNLPAWPGLDIARRAVLRDDETSGWLVDLYGGVHAFGDAPRTFGGAYFPGWDVARGLLADEAGGRVRVLDTYGRLNNISLRPSAVLAEPPEVVLAFDPPVVEDNAGVDPLHPGANDVTPGEGGDEDPNRVMGASCAAVPLFAPWLLLLALGSLRRRRH